MEGRHGDGSPEARWLGLAPGLAKVFGEALVVLVLGGSGDEPEFLVFEFGDGCFDHAVIPTCALVDAAGFVGRRLEFVRSDPRFTLIVGKPGPAATAMAGDDDAFVVVDPKRASKNAAGFDAISVVISDEIPLSVDATFRLIESVYGVLPPVERFKADEFTGDRTLSNGG